MPDTDLEIKKISIDIKTHGLFFSEDIANSLPRGRFGEMTFKDYPTTGGLVLELENEEFINVSLIHHDNWKYKIIRENGNMVIVNKQSQHIARAKKIYSPPRFVLENRKLSTGTPARNLVVSHGDRARISPIAGCHYNCWFCNLPRLRYIRNSVEELTEAFDMALEDDILPIRHAIISGGTPKASEQDYGYLNRIFQEFPRKYPDMEFDIMLSPRALKPSDNETEGYKDFLEFLTDSGIHGLSVNLELHNSRFRQRFIPEKEKIGLEAYLDFIEYGTEILGAGKMRSLLIVGLEPMEDTLKGVRAIAERGGIPILSPLIPDPGTFLATHPAPSSDLLFETYRESGKILEDYPVSLGPECRACRHNVIC